MERVGVSHFHIAIFYSFLVIMIAGTKVHVTSSHKVLVTEFVGLFVVGIDPRRIINEPTQAYFYE